MTGPSYHHLQKPIVYVCRDIERALGIPITTENYYIITNSSAFAKSVTKGHQNALLIEGKEPLDTRDLLTHPKTVSWLQTIPDPHIIVFKNTTQIEKVCQEKGWTLLNPSGEKARQVEEKISQLTWLGPLQKYLPPHQVELCENLSWTGKKYIVQFNHAHTGLGTILITSVQTLATLKKKFPKRSVRVTDFIAGPAFTNNNVIWGKQVLIGNINYQITGRVPFTASPFATIGNDWTLPKKLLNTQQIKRYKQIVNDVSKKLARDGWRGLFGIDTILDEKTGRLYLIEINARQPASTTFESQLQQTAILNEAKPDNQAITTFQAHLLALLNRPYKKQQLAIIKNGAQIIKRISNKQLLPETDKIINLLTRLALSVIPYDNTEPGADWLRIQSEQSMMAGHNRFSPLGKKIKYLLI